MRDVVIYKCKILINTKASMLAKYKLDSRNYEWETKTDDVFYIYVFIIIIIFMRRNFFLFALLNEKKRYFF